MLCLLCYANTLRAPFVFDDAGYIENNPLIKESVFFLHPVREMPNLPENVRTHLLTRYVPYLSFYANHSAGGLSVEGYHAVNISIHIANSLLVFLISTLILKTPAVGDRIGGPAKIWMPVFLGAVFAAHPIQTQAVTYISQRFTSLAAMFYFGSLALYLYSRLAPEGLVRRVSFWASFLAALTGMFAKEVMFTLPFALALAEFSFFDGRAAERLKRLSPFILLLPVIPILLGFSGASGGGRGLDESLNYLFTEFRVIVTYLRLLVIPINQNIDYLYYPRYFSFFEAEVLVSLGFLLVLFGTGIFLLLKKRNRPWAALAGFGIIWFFLALGVESSVIALDDVMFEHRLYIPSFGAFLAFSAIAFECHRLLLGNPRLRGIPTTALVVIPLALGVFTIARNSVWQDKISLWEDSVSKTPENPRAHFNLGIAYQEAGMFDPAEAHFISAIPPGINAGRYGNLAGIYIEREKAENALGIHETIPGKTSGADAIKLRIEELDKAEGKYLNAVKTELYLGFVYNNLGHIYRERGELEKAEAHYRASIALNPESAEPYINLGNIYYELGLSGEALENFQKAISLMPGSSQAWNNLGSLLYETGRLPEAESSFRRAILFNPDDYYAHYNLAALLAETERRQEALPHFEKTVSLKPDYVPARMGLAHMYYMMGQAEKAKAQLREILRLDPGNAEASGILNRI